MYRCLNGIHGKFFTFSDGDQLGIDLHAGLNKDVVMNSLGIVKYFFKIVAWMGVGGGFIQCFSRAL
jgi:hypothetical protein